MSKPFHLAIPAGNLDTAIDFYKNVLGCKLGNGEKDKWIDVDFWGNELTPVSYTHLTLPTSHNV